MKLPGIFDDSNLPIRLGSPLRVPHYAWHNWGIEYGSEVEFHHLVKLSEDEYRSEWDWTTDERHGDIAIASKKAGLEDANARLNKAVANVVFKIIRYRNGRIRILDVGAGSGQTTLAVIRELDELPIESAEFFLFDPAKKALQAGARRLAEIGLNEGENFHIYPITDLNMSNYVQEESADIVVSVASIHHHAFLGAVFELIFKLCKRNGVFIIGDWHNSMWEHPNKVFAMLSKMDWTEKSKDLDKFTTVFPEALTDPGPEEDQRLNKANEQIKAFWKFYSRIGVEKNKQFSVLEGHRPTWRYRKEMERCGFSTSGSLIDTLIPTNPRPLLPDSSLLCITIGQKRG